MNSPRILSREQMRMHYGSFFESSTKVELDRAKIPKQFWELIPYAEFWGIADDSAREQLLSDAPSEILQNLKQVVQEFDNALDEWLAGPEADNPEPSDEYIAFCAMGMAADFI